MKKQRLLSSLFVLLTFSASIASAQDKEKKKYEFAKERDFTQTYAVTGNDKLKISNQFGKVDIKTWNKNEVKVDVHIATSSNIKEANDDRFESIDIKHSKEGSNIYFETEMNNNGNKNYKGNQNNTIDIDYVVYMPANIALNVKNKFGKTIIPDLNTEVKVEQQFGELVAGRLSQTADIVVKFSKASFESLNNADLNIEFAKDPVVIKNATGKLDITVKHSKPGVTVYADQLADLEADVEFSNFGLVLGKNASADFRIKTNFGSLSNKTSFTIKDEDEDRDERKYGPTFTHSYKGTAGNGKLKVDVDGKHSDIIVSNEAPDFSTIKPKKKKKEVI